MTEALPIPMHEQGGGTMLAAYLNNFQYQDKISLRRALKEESNYVPFALAVQQFVDNFEQSYSVDAPYPKRIGRWVGLHAPQPVIDMLMEWAKSQDDCHRALRYRGEFLDALDVARKIDRSTRPQMTDAA